MGTTKLLTLVLAIGLSCCVLPSRSQAKQESVPAYYEHLPQWHKAVQMKKRLDACRYIDEKTKATLSQTFSHLQKEHALFFATTPPVFQDLSDFRKQLEAHNRDARAQRNQAAALQQEIDATSEDARTESWASGVNERVKSLNQWEKRIGERKRMLDARRAVLEQQCSKMYRAWASHRKGFSGWLTHLSRFSQGVADAEKAFRTAPGRALALERLEQDFGSMLDSAESRDNPLDAPILNDETDRSAYNYSRVIEQFNVEESKRYATDDDTHCNTFARDVAWAMGVELPRGANTTQMVEWLPSEAGRAEGWRLASTEVVPEERADAAQAMANKGRLVIAIIPGHVAVIRPGSVMANQTPEDRVHGPAVAQAGNSVVDAAHLSAVFVRDDFKRIQYWYHN